MSKAKTSSLRYDYDEEYLKVAKRPTEPLAVKVGEIVQWTKYYLKSTGHGPTSEAWSQEGKVASICDEGAFKGWPRVFWLGNDEPTLVNPANLCHPGANLRRLE